MNQTGSFLAIFLVIWIVGLVLTVWALVDCIRVPDDSMYRAGTKLIWVLVILFANIVGAIIYFVVGRPVAGATPSPPPPSPSPGEVPPMPPPPG